MALEQALGEDTRKYVDIMQRVVNREETVVELELDDVLAVSDSSGFDATRITSDELVCCCCVALLCRLPPRNASARQRIDWFAPPLSCQFHAP